MQHHGIPGGPTSFPRPSSAGAGGGIVAGENASHSGVLRVGSSISSSGGERRGGGIGMSNRYV